MTGEELMTSAVAAARLGVAVEINVYSGTVRIAGERVGFLRGQQILDLHAQLSRLTNTRPISKSLYRRLKELADKRL